MSEEISLEESILTWVNSFDCVEPKVTSFSQLSDATQMLKILHTVDPSLWSLKILKKAHSNLKTYNYEVLKVLYKGIQRFSGIRLGIQVSDDLIDLKACSEISSESDESYNRNELLKL